MRPFQAALPSPLELVSVPSLVRTVSCADPEVAKKRREYRRPLALLESESGDVVIPMESHGVDASGKLVCSIEVRLGGGAGGLMVPGNAPDGLALRVESAGLWHRRMGQINGKSLDVLRKLAAFPDSNWANNPDN